MSVQSIYNNVATANTNTTGKATDTKKENKEAATTNKTGFEDTAVVYEKSKETETVKSNVTNKVDREAIIAQIKAENEARINQMQELVRKMMQGQGNALAQSDDIWSFLASGDYTVTEAAKLQAQEDISENGYWGVEQTSQRILDFAKALSGGDASKADLLLDAFKKGYEEATGAWGKELPEISKKTYAAVEEKFAAWKEEAGIVTETTPESTVDTTTETTK